MRSAASVAAVSWPIERVGEAMEALAQRAGLALRDVEVPTPPAEARVDALDEWGKRAAHCLGVEAEPVAIMHSELAATLAGAAPALIQVVSDPSSPPQFVALAKTAGSTAARVLGPDRVERRIPVSALRAALCERLERPIGAEVDRLLDGLEVSETRRARVRSRLIGERLAGRHVSRGWLLRDDPGTSFWRALRRGGLSRKLGWLIGAHLLQYLLVLVGWWLLGQGALTGRFDRGWLWAWLLLLLTLIPFRVLTSQLAGWISIDAGGLLKQRLLAGALRLAPESIRHQGAGQLLSQVLDSEAIESLAIGGAFVGLMAVFELLIAAVVIALGAGGLLETMALLVWAVVTGLLARRYFQRCRRWTQRRLTMTHDLVERMVGHRTRLAQEQADRWHDAEDQTLEGYLEDSRAMDRASVYLSGFVPRGWLAIGVTCLLPAFTGGESAAALAIGLGGTLLSYRALRKLMGSLSRLVTAAISWQNVSGLFEAAARRDSLGSAAFSAGRSLVHGRVLLEAHDLSFRYADRGEPVLRGCNLGVRHGERLLLEGPSGGGKSTLASLLVGLRLPTSGLLLLDGLDRQTLGTDLWRQRIVAAPQFHENYVFLATFAFNLLLGRGWPPSQKDLNEAKAICRELDLGPLIQRMPAGIHQIVGETGWQLSHGERSRLYIARALLQGAEMVVLDESFAALDPETLQRAMECVLRRAKTLLVIAHP